MNKSRIQIRQRDRSDCAAACLVSIAAAYRLLLPLSRVRQWAGTNAQGTTLMGIIQAAEKMGFQSKAVRSSAADLFLLPCPAIAHSKNPDGSLHFMVILSVGRKRIRLMDPADGRIRSITLSGFSQLWTGILILLEPGPDFRAGKMKKGRFERFLELLAPNAGWLLIALICALIHTVLGLSFSIFIQQTVDIVLTRSRWDFLHSMGRIMLLLLACQVIIAFTRSIIMLKAGRQTDKELMMGYYSHLLKLPQTFFDSMQVGELISRLNDAVKIRVFINEILLQLVVDATVIILSFAAMFYYNWKLALMASIMLPVFSVLLIWQNSIGRKWHRAAIEKSAGLETQFVESITAAASIKRLGIEQMMYDRTKAGLDDLCDAIFHANRKSLQVTLSAETISRYFILLILWMGAGMVLKQQLSVGELLSFFALTAYMIGPATNLIYANRRIQDAAIAADRLFEIMELEPEKINKDLPEIKLNDAEIRFSNLQFGYLNRYPVLKNLELTIAGKTITAIVGESGSGKTTLLSLLQGIYPVQMGEIFIGERSIREIDTEILRRKIAVVPQRIDLFSGTIFENITIGYENPDPGRMLEICEKLGLNKFVYGLPEGYLTMVSEQAVNLSAGQKQKIGIARALYRNPEILVLDEATSGMDAISAAEVQETLRWFRDEGKTILFITHRITNIRECDEVLVMKEGCLHCRGRHEKLLTADPYYASLCGGMQ